ncbi:MAG TPA: ATP synthase F1 subunit gamma [Chthoniobacterales bacterium]|jgi:F-type H+-transporting ATPase subunit gamma
MAANTRDIRRRIKSVKNTAQITKAMQMVAASKMRKAQQLALDARPYSVALRQMTLALRKLDSEKTHPLLEARSAGKQLVLVVATDKGLCGALNTNLLREASKFDASKTIFVTLGRKASQWVARNKRELQADFPLKDAPAFSETKTVSKFLVEKFLAGEVDSVSVLYTDFKNTLTQVPKTVKILPITAELEELDFNNLAGDKTIGADTRDILFEPDPYSFLEALLPYSVHIAVFNAVLEARASEHSARMVAMKAATDNAKSLIKDLSLEYNKLRQASITTELLEISTAQMVLGQ